MGSNRSQRRHQAAETLEILEAGRYLDPTGAVRTIGPWLAEARRGTTDYPPDDAPPSPAARFGETDVEVVAETTLAGAAALVREGHDVMALNFASAKNPGGGFLGGSEAQEEFLARSSGLFPCLRDQPMYAHHRTHADCLYTSWMIYSPGVPVLRDDAGALLETPYRIAMVTAPAPNAGVVLEREPEREAEVRAALRDRIAKVLAIAAAHGHDAVVLGAWGCGVFRNDPEEVAALFAEAIHDRFPGVVRRARFSVLDRTKDRAVLGAFRRRLGEARTPGGAPA
jgi:uncharacterized protein (TIGR02452 family)